MAYRDIILSKTIDYVRTKKLTATNRGAIVMVDCPYCHTVKSAQIIQALGHIHCVCCQKHFTLIDLVRINENKLNDSEEEILNYVRNLLGIDVQTTSDADSLEKELKIYSDRGWAIVPCAKAAAIGHSGEKVSTGKEVIQSEWQKKENRNVSEWFHWVSSGLNLGVRTGQVSNLTIIDFDLLSKEEKADLVRPGTSEARKAEIMAKKAIPDEIKGIMGETLMQESHGGFHAFYTYSSELRKTGFNHNGLHIDIENDLGQVIIPPSQKIGVEEEFKDGEDVKKRIVGYAGRHFINDIPMIPIPTEFLNWLKEKTDKTPKTVPEESGKISEALNLPEDFKIKDIQGNRNNTLLSLGGIFRKEMNVKQTGFVLNVLNKHLLENPLPSSEIQHILEGLSNYIGGDDSVLAHDIVAYLKDTDTASKIEIESAIFGGKTTSENKKRLDRTLMCLVRDEKILKKNSRDYKILKNMEWSDDILNIGQPINFKMPYFNDYAYFNWGDLILIGAVQKFGKCFTKDTGILMADGNIKNVQDIKKGELIQGVNNQIRIVKDTCIGKGKVYKITPTNNTSFTVNGEHILCLVNVRNKKKINISVNDYLLKTDGFKSYHKLYRDTVEWSKKEVSIEPYFMGAWLGDGTSCSSNITSQDKEIIKYLEQYAKRLKTPFIAHHHSNRCSNYSITDKNIPWQHKNSLQQKLRDYGVINNKHVPFEYKITDKESRLQLLAGIIDTDGYLTKKGNYELSFVNKQLAEDVIFIARSLGFSAKLRTDKAMFNTLRHRFQIVGDTTIIPTKIIRKQSNKKSVNKNPLYSGFKIEEKGIENYYGFILDGDHLFLLDNFIVNHNTSLAMNFVHRLVKQGVKPHYIYNESGGRFATTALKLGMKDGDFYRCRCSNPDELILKPNSIYVYDWIRPRDFSKTDELFEKLVDKIDKANSIMIGFVQLREGSEKNKNQNDWFAKDLIRQYVSISAKYLYEDKEGTNTYFELGDIRDSKTWQKYIKIPCKYVRETREVKAIEEIDREENDKKIVPVVTPEPVVEKAPEVVPTTAEEINYDPNDR